jgi:hypothetical protein
MGSLGAWLSKGYRDNPVFVVGAGRSGTSILLQALGQHSRILSSDQESPFISFLGASIQPLEFGPFEFRDTRQYYKESLNVPMDYLYGELRRLCLEVAMGPDFGIGSKLGLRSARKALRARRWCAKTYPNALQTAGLIRLFPNVRILHIFRNGIDVVNSRSRFRGMKSYEFSEHCEIWARHVDKYSHMFELPQALPVRHEDVSAAPDDVFRRILEFVGLQHEDGPATFAKSTLIHSLDQRTRAGVDVRKALTERRPAHESWTDDQKGTFVQICGSGMKKLGYEIPF